LSFLYFGEHEPLKRVLKVFFACMEDAFFVVIITVIFAFSEPIKAFLECSGWYAKISSRFVKVTFRKIDYVIGGARLVRLAFFNDHMTIIASISRISLDPSMYKELHLPFQGFFKHKSKEPSSQKSLEIFLLMVQFQCFSD